MTIWIARDSDGSLYVYRKKPLHNGGKTFIAQSSQWWRIDKNAFPEVTFGNSPIEVELKLVNNVQGK